MTKIISTTLPENWFREWFNTPYYHQLYFEHNEKEAEALVRRLIEHLRPAPNSRMIDVGCGRGRHSKVLASLDFDVTGIDIAPDSILYARKFENDHLHFFEHDIRLPFWINYFQYAFNLFTSFGYFRTEREHYNSIRTIAQSLTKDGVFVLDYLNTHYAEDHLIHQSEKHFDGVTYYLTKWFDETHFFKRIVIEDYNRKSPLEFVERVAKYTLGDFNDMFAFHGLQMQEVFGNYELESYNVKHSPRLMMIAKKIG